VFDAFQKHIAHNVTSTYVLLQLIPGLLDFNPFLMPERLPYHSSVYIGMMEEDGSGGLFAMSPSQYPFVALRDGASHSSQVDRVAQHSLSSDMDVSVEEGREIVHMQEKEEERCSDLNIIECFLGVIPWSWMIRKMKKLGFGDF